MEKTQVSPETPVWHHCLSYPARQMVVRLILCPCLEGREDQVNQPNFFGPKLVFLCLRRQHPFLHKTKGPRPEPRLPSRRPRRGGGGLGKWASVSPPPAEQFSSRPISSPCRHMQHTSCPCLPSPLPWMSCCPPPPPPFTPQRAVLDNPCHRPWQTASPQGANQQEGKLRCCPSVCAVQKEAKGAKKFQKKNSKNAKKFQKRSQRDLQH